jgi:hypothetical protein
MMNFTDDEKRRIVLDMGNMLGCGMEMMIKFKLILSFLSTYPHRVQAIQEVLVLRAAHLVPIDREFPF